MKPTKALLFSCLAIAGSVAAADLAQAQLVLNGAGSSAGRQYAALLPTDLALCDNTTTPVLFQSHEVPPNRVEWQCTLNGGTRVYRYSASASADGYTKLPNGATATAAYLNLTTATTGACPTPVAGTVNGRSVLISTCGTPAGPNNVPPAVVNAPASNFVVHYGASDVKPSSFNATAGGSSISPPAAGHLTPNPIVAVPFSIVVGGNVRAGNGTSPLLNLTQLEVRQILSGDITAAGGDWTTLGHNTTTSNKTITVCQRTVVSGTLATLMQTVMQSPGWFSSIDPVASATNIFNASSSNVKSCVENNPNSIGYIDSDTVPSLLLGAYQVALDGFLPSNPALPAGIDRTRDLRCGKYAFWADWVIVTRNSGIEAAPVNAPIGSNALLTLLQNRAIAVNPLPNFWGRTDDMFVFKSNDSGPHNWFSPNGAGANAATVCSNAGSTQ